MNFLNFSTNVTAIVTFCCSYDFFNTYIAIYIYFSFDLLDWKHLPLDDIR